MAVLAFLVLSLFGTGCAWFRTGEMSSEEREKRNHDLKLKSEHTMWAPYRWQTLPPPFDGIER